MLRVFKNIQLRLIHSLARNAITGYKSVSGEDKFRVVQQLLKTNLEISRLNSALHTLMTLSKSDAAYRIFMMYLSSGRKLEGIDSSCFDYMIKVLVKHERMDEAEKVWFYLLILKVMLAMQKFKLKVTKEHYVTLLRGYARVLNRKYLAKEGFDIQLLLDIFEKIKRKYTLNVTIYNIIFKVMAKRGLLGVMVDYYGEMLQNRIFPNVETSLYFTLAISKRMEKENVIQAFIPMTSYYPEPKSIIKMVNDMLLRRLSYTYLEPRGDLQSIKRNFGLQELVPSIIKGVIERMELDNGEDTMGVIEAVNSNFLYNSQKIDLFSDFDYKEIRAKAYGLLIMELSQRGFIDLVKEKFHEMVNDGITPSVQVYTAVMSMLGSLNDLEGVNFYLNDMRQRNVNPNSTTYHILLSILSRKNADISRISELDSEEFDQDATITVLQADITKSKTEEQKLISSITFETDLKPSKYVYHNLICNLIKFRIPTSSPLRFDQLNYIYGRIKEDDGGSEVPFSISVIDGIIFELEDNLKPPESQQLDSSIEQNSLFDDYAGLAPCDSTIWLAEKVFEDMIKAGMTPFETTCRYLYLGHIARKEISKGIAVLVRMQSEFNIQPSLGFRIDVYRILIHKRLYKLLAEVINLCLTDDCDERDWMYIRYLIFYSALSQESKRSDSMIDQVMNIHLSLAEYGKKIHKAAILDALYICGFVDNNDCSFSNLWDWVTSSDLVDGDIFLYYIEKLLISGKTDVIMTACTHNILEKKIKLELKELDKVLLFLDQSGSGLLAAAIRFFWRNHSLSSQAENQE